jgi:heme/copper-type cytochrome/quinol oxidase subunit 4
MSAPTGTTSTFGYVTEPLPLPPLPTDRGSTGPVTRRTTRRLVAWVMVWLAATTVAAWLLDGRAQTFVLGLTLPGGGFLAHLGGGAGTTIVHLLLFVLSVLLTVIAYLSWVGTGNLVGVPVVVVLMAGFATLMGTGGHHMVMWDGARVLVPALAVATLLVIWLLVARDHAAAVARRPQVNAMLDRVRPTTAVTVVDDAGLPVVEEMTPETLALQRFVLDRALQPVETFDGYDKLDQFREGAPRYQTCLSSYALSVSAYAHTPAFRGYVAEGQRRFGLKMQDHHVWGYWRVENLWGRLHQDPNPVAVNNNIMWTGWYAGMLGMLESASGVGTFSEPGGVTLRHPRGKEYVYDYAGLCDNLYDNFTASAFTLWPCEPGWTYPMCNNFGAIGLIAHDRMHGTDYWSRVVDDYRRRLEDEFVTADGKVVALRHTYMGLGVTPMNSTMPAAMVSLYMSAVFPDLAARTWAIARDRAVRFGDDGIEVDLALWDLIDFGNYKPSRFTSYAMIAAAAREVGDHEVADALLAKLQDVHPLVVEDGVGHFDGRSVGAHATVLMASGIRPHGLHDLVQVGMPDPWRHGPLLDDVVYPDVLVARAVSDGADLSLTLDPGRAGGLRSSVGVTQLRPGSAYRVDGGVEERVVADADGAARVTVDLPGRTRVRLVPEV